jgi:F-type H+-transporting ATPase subunit delta
VCSASPLTDAEQLAKIQASLEKRYWSRTVKLNCSVDPSLMAGVVIKAGDDGHRCQRSRQTQPLGGSVLQS